MQKTRGKRPASEAAGATSASESPAKKSKTDEPLSEAHFASCLLSLADDSSAQYEKEVKSYAGRSLKDDGIGVRPLVK